MSDNVDTMVQEIRERILAMPDADSLVMKDQVNDLVRDVVQAMLEDPEFERQMRFPGEGDSRLVGSKFARWGLNTADIEFLHDWTVAMSDYNPRKYPGPSDELRNAFNAISNAQYIPEEEIKRIDKTALDDMFPRIPKSAFTGRDAELFAKGRIDEMEAYNRAVRAMDTAESGYGSQLVGAEYVGELWTAARLRSRIFGLLQTHEMIHPTTYVPVEADIPEMLYVSENTGPTDSPYGTSKTGSNRVTLTAKKFVIHQVWSGEMQEDSIIPWIPFLRRQVVLSLAHYSDSVVLNGDVTNAATGNINLDDADPSDTKHYLASDGLRHIGLVDATANQINANGAITYAHLHNIKSKLIDTTYLMHWGAPTDPRDLVYISDPYTSIHVQQLDEIVNQKNMRNRPLLAGEVADILGHPFIESMAMSLTEADGKVSTTANNNIKGQIQVFNRRGAMVGWRRRLKMEVERMPGRDQDRMVHSLRMGFGRYSPTGAASGIKIGATIFNIAV